MRHETWREERGETRDERRERRIERRDMREVSWRKGNLLDDI